jgi:hypothetical protein
MKIILVFALTALVATVNFDNALSKLSFKLNKSFSEKDHTITFVENKFCWQADQDLKCLVRYTEEGGKPDAYGEHERQVIVKVTLTLTFSSTWTS